MPSYTLEQLISLADEAYPEGLVLASYRNRWRAGDTLAYSIASNIEGTFEADLDRPDQLRNAIAVLESLQFDLMTVRDHLLNELSRVEGE